MSARHKHTSKLLSNIQYCCVLNHAKDHVSKRSLFHVAVLRGSEQAEVFQNHFHSNPQLQYTVNQKTIQVCLCFFMQDDTPDLGSEYESHGDDGSATNRGGIGSESSAQVLRHGRLFRVGEVADAYIRLLCTYAPSAVLPFLTHGPTEYDVRGCIGYCREVSSSVLPLSHHFRNKYMTRLSQTDAGVASGAFLAVRGSVKGQQARSGKMVCVWKAQSTLNRR